jgi:hypothetical protein
MFMGFTGAVDLILPLSMVASLMHQSIININKRNDDYMTRSSSPWNSNICMLFPELMGYELKNMN